MSGRLGESAVRLAGIAARLLGWRPEEFWNATPAELATALVEGGDAIEPVSGGEVQALMARFPDGEI